MDEYRRRNREHWEELVRIHPGTNFYDVEAFLDGESTLRPLECEAIGNVEGCSMLHLQCHFGLDSLSWAREGADVAGVDFSDTAIEAARDLAAEADLTGRARFLATDVYDLPERLADAHGTFDLVFTSYGVLGWLPDVEAWAEVVAAFVQPGGRFYIAEIHPVSHALMDLRLDTGVWDRPGRTSATVRSNSTRKERMPTRTPQSNTRRLTSGPTPRARS